MLIFTIDGKPRPGSVPCHRINMGGDFIAQAREVAEAQKRDRARGVFDRPVYLADFAHNGPGTRNWLDGADVDDWISRSPRRMWQWRQKARQVAEIIARPYLLVVNVEAYVSAWTVPLAVQRHLASLAELDARGLDDPQHPSYRAVVAALNQFTVQRDEELLRRALAPLRAADVVNYQSAAFAPGTIGAHGWPEIARRPGRSDSPDAYVWHADQRFRGMDLPSRRAAAVQDVRTRLRACVATAGIIPWLMPPGTFDESGAGVSYKGDADDARLIAQELRRLPVRCGVLWTPDGPLGERMDEAIAIYGAAA